MTIVERSGRVESVHLGVVAVVDADGTVVRSCGDVGVATYLRSAAKPLQLLAMLECGLAQAGPIEQSDLAVAAASHGGEPGHVEAVRAFMSRVGVSEAALRCGALPPLERRAHHALIRNGVEPGPIHNNCSGKHAAMLATCRVNGWPDDSYLAPDHPLQQAVLETVAGFTAVHPEIGVDGCGVPTFYVPVVNAARSMASLMAEAAGGGNARRVVDAMCGHPWLTSATSRLAYRLMEAVPGVLAKEGAEGFFVLGIPVGRATDGRPLGVALKILDGAGEDARGREPSVAAVLAQVCRLSERERNAVDSLARVPSLNAAGRVVGWVRSVLSL